MLTLRRIAVNHARSLDRAYRFVEKILVQLHPLLNKIGHARLERPFAAIERMGKGVLFDCRMCGQCALSSTGMSCPRNCPKNLANGPCGGVRENGTCEIKPDMPCVWIEAYRGAARMPGGLDAIGTIQDSLNHSLQGRSSFLRVVRERTGGGAGAVGR